MISIFPSEPMAPAQGPSTRSPKAPPEPQDNSDRSSFADLVKTEDETPPKGDASVPTESAELPDKTGDRREFLLSFEGEPGGQTRLEGKVEIAEAEIEAPKLTPAETETAEPVKATKADLAIASAEIAPRELKTREPALTETAQASREVELARATETPRPEADAEVPVKSKTDLAAPVELKKEAATKTRGADTEVTADLKLTAQPEGEAGETLRIQRGDDAAETIRAEYRDPLNGKSADAAQTADKLILGAEKVTQTAIGRDAPMVVGESVLATVQTQQAAQTQATTPGLTPTAPGLQVASPNEITSIILNNLRSGVEPQEQLIIQLDPPELGRVSIDFKFDAQGVQQITVTTENPEALKRLRELHFELTEALKDHGLSEKNMSFKQESGDQSASQWQLSDRGSGAFGARALEENLGQPVAVQTRATPQSTSRLDLTL